MVAALSTQARQLPTALRRSLTLDQGMELVQHKQFILATHMQVYFCDPQSLWQRGINDNTNRLLRQYLSRGGDSLTIRAAGDADSMKSHTVG